MALGGAAANLTAGLHAGFTEMTVEDLRAAMDADRDVLLLDVRAIVAPPVLVSRYAPQLQTCRDVEPVEVD